MRRLPFRLGPYEEIRGWVRGAVVAAMSGLFLTISGAFGTDDAPLGVRFAYWMGLMALGFFWGAFVSSYFFRDGRTQPSPARTRARRGGEGML